MSTPTLKDINYGYRKACGETVFMSMINLTAWQIERLLPYVISIRIYDYMEKTICIPEINKSDVEAVQNIVFSEDILCV